MTTMNRSVDYYSAQAFLDAWLRGVELAGPQWFGDGSGRGSSRDDYAPRYDAINDNLGVLSSGEAAFLAAMYSFYNARTGGVMLQRLDITGLAHLTSRLDEPRCRVIADLLVSYAGW